MPLTREEFAGFFTPCRTGRHLWFNEYDAAKCCTGLERIIVFSLEEADTWLFVLGFGYKWVTKEEYNRLME